MLFPMIVIAFLCILFGVFNSLPLNMLIQPILGEARLEGKDFSGFPTNFMLVVVTLIVLIGALLNHLWGVKRKGSGLKAVDHIHYAPVLSGIYDKAEKRYFDPFEIGLKISGAFSKAAFACDRAIDWLYDNLTVKSIAAFTNQITRLHNGNYSRYLVWSLLGLVLIIIFLV